MTIHTDLIDVIDVSDVPENPTQQVVTVMYSTPVRFREREWSFTINLN